MNKIQAKGSYKSQRKRRTPAVGLSQVAASKISHPKHSEHSADRSGRKEIRLFRAVNDKSE
jgi:hypothetical protein